MTVQTAASTNALSNSVRTKYEDKYLEAADFVKLYDQVAKPYGQASGLDPAFFENVLQIPFLSDMQPGTTAISETADISPQALKDATATVTPTSRGEAIQWSQELDLKAFTNYGEKRFSAIGKNMQESIELLAIAAALQGGNVLRAAARASLDAGTAAHNLTMANVEEAMTVLQVLKCPAYVANGRPQWFMIMHGEPYYDLRSQGAISSVALYQDKEIILRGELGQVGNFKILSSPWAKVFGGAGADNATNVADTLASAAAALATQIVVTSGSNMTAGDYFTIGTEETANTFQPLNERVKVSSAYVSGTTVDIIGEGANGGLRFAHDAAVAVRNADSVFPVLFAGPSSLCKVYATEVGEFGEIVGPKQQGLLNQFGSLGWKWWGQYGRFSESWLVRGEYSASLEA